MALQFSTALRNAQANQLESTVGASAKLQIRSGAPPANCAAADSGTLLAELTLPADWLAAAANGAVALAGSWAGTVANAGTAAHFRIKDSAGAATHAQGTVTATGGGGDMTLDNVVLAAAQNISIATFTYTRGNA